MTSPNTQQHFLLVDDDEVFCSILSRALERREITTSTANSPQQAIELIQQLGNIFSHAVIDLNMGKESGLALIPQLLNFDAQLKIIVLTGYSSIATTVEASSSPRADVMDWSSDAVNGFGFICNSGKVKVSDLSSALCPSLLLGKEGELAILEDVRAEQFIIFDGKTRKKRKLTKKEFKEWYSGKLLFAQPALEEHKTVKSRLKALRPCDILMLYKMLKLFI